MSKFFKILSAAVIALTLSGLNAQAQNQQQRQRPDPSQAVKEVVDRVYNYLDGCTPAEVVDANGKTIKNLNKIDENSSFKRGDFGINTYEWGVTYSGMLLLSKVTGDPKYADYAYERMQLIGKVYEPAKKYYDETGYRMRFHAIHTPKWLDDCGSMSAAMMKGILNDPARSKDFRALMERWFNFTMYEEYRLTDGILARTRPTVNSVWLDDMYMGIPPIAYRAAISQRERGDLTQKLFNEAANQILLFKKYLWVDETEMFRHGWIEGMSEHPNYYWARANGWAMLTISDVLDVLPKNHPARPEILETLKTLIRTVAKYQAPNGLWHQLIDQTESYLETSASAMFVYCMAHAINEGWIDRTAYQDIVRAGWAGVTTQVTEEGKVDKTCVGTGLGWTNTWYEGRPANVTAPHGYGPVLLAGAEVMRMYAIQAEQRAQQAGRMQGFTRGGVQRVEGKPMVFLAGDSTCKNGTGNGASKQWGWGSFFQEYLTDQVVVENDAVGGLSSRTFFNNNWPALRDKIQKGDYVLIQFGHNDMAPLNTGRARGTLSGTGAEKQTVVMEKHGGPEDVYSYGHYVRMMVRQTKIRGGIPIVLSPTPQNRWANSKSVNRFADTYNAWCKEVAEQEGVVYIDVNELAGQAYDKMGQKAAQADYFADSVHTLEKGARLYCETISEALKASKSPLGKFVK